MKSKKNNSTIEANSKPGKGKGRVTKVRLDQLLVARGLADDLAHAGALVMAGKVVVGDQRADKAGETYPDSTPVRVKDESRFVSRGGEKLWAALHDLDLVATLKGAVVLDVGASTGGFTHCCLELGAKHVLSLDVGTSQLAWELRQDPRVTVIEQTDVRDFAPSTHPTVDLVVADVSFNSLARLAPAIRRAAPTARMLLMVKPQFELPRDAVPKGGVVVDPVARQTALASVVEAFAAIGMGNARSMPSRVPGRTGNEEIFLYLEPQRAFGE